MKCDLCGTHSDFDAAFIKQRKSFSSRIRNICPACWIKRANRSASRVLLAIPVMFVCGYVADRLEPGGVLGQILLNFSLIAVFLVLAVVPHELGHTIAARALGWRVYQIVIGVGKQIWKRRWHDIVLDVRSIPVTGVTFMVPKDTRWFRLKFFLAILAGPAVNAAMAWAAIIIWQGSLSDLDFGALPKAARLFVWANAWVVCVNLWPHRPKTGFGLATDGARLLQLLSFGKKALNETQAMRFLFDAGICRDRSDLAGARSWCDKGLALHPQDSNLLNFSGINYLDEGQYEKARGVFLELLAKEKTPSATRAILLNNIAYADALSQNPDWLSEADAYSKDAWTMAPWVAAVVGTRGTVLVALGNHKEAIELLKKSMEDATTPRNKAENACHIAIALAKIGEHAEAMKYLQLAKELGLSGPVFHRAELALKSPETEDMLGQSRE
jgi:tetratricopeptide (TPR) repeat protein